MTTVSPDGPVPPERRLGYEDYWRVADALEFTSHPYGGVVYDGDGDRVAFDGDRMDALTDMAAEGGLEDTVVVFVCRRCGCRWSRPGGDGEPTPTGRTR